MGHARARNSEMPVRAKPGGCGSTEDGVEVAGQEVGRGEGGGGGEARGAVWCEEREDGGAGEEVEGRRWRQEVNDTR